MSRGAILSFAFPTAVERVGAAQAASSFRFGRPNPANVHAFTAQAYCE